MTDSPVKPARLVAVRMLYHQRPGQQPTGTESRWSRQLRTDGDVYTRPMKAGEAWQEIDTGWVERVAMLGIENREGHFTQVIPTPEERLAAEAKVLEIGVLLPGTSEPYPVLLVPVREAHDYTPVHLGGWFVRCRSGEAKCVLTVIPE